MLFGRTTKYFYTRLNRSTRSTVHDRAYFPRTPFYQRWNTGGPYRWRGIYTGVSRAGTVSPVQGPNGPRIGYSPNTRQHHNGNPYNSPAKGV